MLHKKDRDFLSLSFLYQKRLFNIHVQPTDTPVCVQFLKKLFVVAFFLVILLQGFLEVGFYCVYGGGRGHYL